MSGDDEYPYPETFTLKINAPLQPLHRDVFEDPLQEALEAADMGEVAGGGTMLDDDKEILWCDTDIATKDASDATRDWLLAELGKLGIPKGSTLTGPDEVAHPVGDAEGLAVRLSGEVLEANFEEHDINDLIAKINDATGDLGTMLSFSQAPARTSLFYFGDSFAAMRDAMAPIIAADTLGEGHSIDQIA